MVSRCYRLPRVCECGVHGRAVWLATLLGVDVSNTPTISAEFITCTGVGTWRVWVDSGMSEEDTVHSAHVTVNGLTKTNDPQSELRISPVKSFRRMQ